MKNEQYTKISDLEPNKPTARPVFLRRIEDLGKTAQGKDYVALHVNDGYSNYRVHQFDVTAKILAERGITEGNIYVCKFFKTDKGFINLGGDPIACLDPDISIRDFGQHIEGDPEEYFGKIIQLLETVRRPIEGKDALSDLAIALLRRYHDDFVKSAAAISMHHEVGGGLVLHSFDIACSAYLLLKIYKDMDPELLVCGAALHDIGKIREYATDDMGYSSFEPMGQAIGHMVYGIEMVDDQARLGNYDSERVELLKHIIASHHGEPEFGAITRPAIPEAELIHALDNVDAKLYMFDKNYKDMKPGTNSEKSVFGLDTRIYKPTFK